jgi:Uma2 family endonuclease
VRKAAVRVVVEFASSMMATVQSEVTRHERAPDQTSAVARKDVPANSGWFVVFSKRRDASRSELMLTATSSTTDHEHYPTSDGEPMAETDVHREQILQLITSLEDFYRTRQDVYVTGNLLVFYQEGDGRKHVAPDVMVVFGVPKHPRERYKIWEEGKAPDVIIEVTSASTRNEDMGSKKGLYALHGVREYFVFDPLREYVPSGLRGFQLAGEDYLRLVGANQKSQVLGLELRVVDGSLRLYDPQAGALLPNHTELVNRLVEVQARAEAEAARAEAEAARAQVEQTARVESDRQRELLAQELEALRRELRSRQGEPSES